jgi:hypothetical protein
MGSGSSRVGARRGLSAQASVGAVEVVEILPLLELGVEQLSVVHHHAVQHPIELFSVDAVRALDLAIQPGRGWLDVDVLDAAVQHVPVEGGLKLGPVIGLDPLNAERQLLEDVVDELDGGLLVEAVVHPQNPNSSAVVDCGELVMLLSSSANRRDELDVDLDLVAGLGLLVSLPSVLVPLVPLRRRQPAHIQALEDPPDAGQADFDLVVALEIHRDLVGPEVVVLAQVDDLANDLSLGGVGAELGPLGSIPVNRQFRAPRNAAARRSSSVWWSRSSGTSERRCR